MITEEEEDNIKYTEYVTQWEKENNERVLSRHGRLSRPKPTTKNNGVSTHAVEGKEKESLPVQEMDNG